MANDDPVEIDGELIEETERGVRIQLAEGAQWFPKSQVTWIDDGKSFTLPEWIAKERGLI